MTTELTPGNPFAYMRMVARFCQAWHLFRGQVTPEAASLMATPVATDRERHMCDLFVLALEYGMQARGAKSAKAREEFKERSEVFFAELKDAGLMPPAQEALAMINMAAAAQTAERVCSGPRLH